MGTLPGSDSTAPNHGTTSAAPADTTTTGGRPRSPQKGYYSFDLGRWRILSLNASARPSAAATRPHPKLEWLRGTSRRTRGVRADLLPEPLFASGARRARRDEAVLGMRSMPRTPASSSVGTIPTTSASPSGIPTAGGSLGIRQFVVGTGEELTAASRRCSLRPERQRRHTGARSLHPSSYDWEFVPEAGRRSRTKAAIRATRDDAVR